MTEILNLNNINNCLLLLSDINYDDFENISDLRDFHRRLYNEVKIIKESIKQQQMSFGDELERFNQDAMNDNEQAYIDFFDIEE